MATQPKESPTKESLNEAYSHLKDAGGSVRDAAKTAGADAQTAARTQYARSRDDLTNLAHRAENSIRERPLTALGIAFASGWLISRLMRK